MKKIKLGNRNCFTFVDDGDFDWLKQWKWHLHEGYVCRNIYIKGSGKKRNLSINGNSTFKELSSLIQKEFNLEPMHLYEFKMGEFKFGPQCDEWQEIFDELDNFKISAAIKASNLSKEDSFKFL